MKKVLSFVLTLTLLVCACASALAAYPEKAVEATVPWAAGGGGDLAFRAFGDVFQKITGQPLVIKNVAGASGVTGVMEFKETAIGDGYQILHWSNAHTSKIHMSVVDYDVDSFKHVAQIVESANYLLVQKDAKWNTIEEFVDDVLANPGMITMANAGVGGGNHIAALLFEEAIGGELAHITYDGGSASVTGLLSGEVDAAMCNTPEGMSNVDAGQLKILCSFASKHFKDYPDVPLAIESSNEALKDLVIEQWRGVAVPIDTPDEIVAELADIIEKVVADEDFIAKCDTLSIVARFRDTEEYTAFVNEENARFENLIKTKGFGDRYGK
ncbi:MAG: tripartite tricarboxylate transporter substrate binding protein [Clostridiales bacterium]|nr:tripartite tricarboxylate transporter substrate binding protein [Clostridiales bacterium]MDO4349123.1 tripartite tricarboxylate transporter substrate binding protein [Eubacteriales bacterium]MDY4007890.1 tripartite tricarboxylate transporter substrate binding protein [Candidatus Limiplasma sp.]